MPMYRKGRGSRDVLNDKEAFMAWHNAGTIEKASLELERHGFINPYTQKPYTSGGIVAAATRYMLQNSDEARKLLIQDGAEGAKDDKVWNKFLVERAMRVWGLSRNAFFSWISEKGFYEEYFDTFKDRFGLTEDDRSKPPRYRRLKATDIFEVQK